MGVADLSQLPKVSMGNGNKATLSLDRFKDDGCRIIGIHLVFKHILFKVRLCAVKVAGAFFQIPGTAEAMGKMNPEYARCPGPGVGLVGPDLARHGHGEHGTAMEGVVKADHRTFFCMTSGDLDGIFNSLGPGVGKHGLGRSAHWNKFVELFRKFHITFIHHHMKTGVKKLICLLFYGLHNFRV